MTVRHALFLAVGLCATLAIAQTPPPAAAPAKPPAGMGRDPGFLDQPPSLVWPPTMARRRRRHRSSSRGMPPSRASASADMASQVVGAHPG